MRAILPHGEMRLFLKDLEQVHVRGFFRRGLRLKLMAGLGVVLASSPFLGATSAPSIATQTSLSVSTSDNNGQTSAAVQVAVTGADGLPATGAVAINEGNRQLAGIVLNSAGQASTTVSLPAGVHTLRAVYAGDSAHQVSTSASTSVTAQANTTPSFQLSLTPVTPSSFPMTLKAGAAGTTTVLITPVNPSALTSPMFVTLSCSGLPNQASCTFSPDSIEIQQNTQTSCASGSSAATCPPTSSMVLQTQSAGTVGQSHPMPGRGRGRGTVAWAILLPGMLGLGGLAWGSRLNKWLSRMALIALVGLVTSLGTAACNPQYYYYNHGPPNNPATPAGTYTVTVTGQSSNGISAITYSTTFVLTVQ